MTIILRTIGCLAAVVETFSFSLEFSFVYAVSVSFSLYGWSFHLSTLLAFLFLYMARVLCLVKLLVISCGCRNVFRQRMVMLGV